MHTQTKDNLVKPLITTFLIRPYIYKDRTYIRMVASVSELIKIIMYMFTLPYGSRRMRMKERDIFSVVYTHSRCSELRLSKQIMSKVQYTIDHYTNSFSFFLYSIFLFSIRIRDFIFFFVVPTFLLPGNEKMFIQINKRKKRTKKRRGEPNIERVNGKGLVHQGMDD